MLVHILLSMHYSQEIATYCIHIIRQVVLVVDLLEEHCRELITTDRQLSQPLSMAVKFATAGHKFLPVLISLTFPAFTLAVLYITCTPQSAELG